MNDDVVTVNELKQAVKKFCDERDWEKFHSPKDLAIGIATEAAELLQIFRFKSENESKNMLKDEKKRKEIGEELADVVYFVLRFAQLYGFDLSNELKNKLSENEKRYPADLARGSNAKYDELESGKT